MKELKRKLRAFGLRFAGKKAHERRANAIAEAMKDCFRAEPYPYIPDQPD